MHREVYNFVKKTLEKILEDGKPVTILEIGSKDVNSTALGMNLRSISLPKGSKYIGVDIEEGPGVDLVCSSHELVKTFGFKKFDIVICCEMLEHDSGPHITADIIHYILKSPGVLILTTAALYRGYHNPPHYWNFSYDAIKHLFRHFREGHFSYLRDGKDIHYIGCKDE